MVAAAGLVVSSARLVLSPQGLHQVDPAPPRLTFRGGASPSKRRKLTRAEGGAGAWRSHGHRARGTRRHHHGRRRAVVVIVVPGAAVVVVPGGIIVIVPDLDAETVGHTHPSGSSDRQHLWHNGHAGQQEHEEKCQRGANQGRHHHLPLRPTLRPGSTVVPTCTWSCARPAETATGVRRCTLPARSVTSAPTPQLMALPIRT